MLVLLVTLGPAIPLPQGAEPSVLAARQTSCSTYSSISGDLAEAAWCVPNCAAGNCPEDKCKCMDAGTTQQAIDVATQVPAVVPTVPDAPAMPGAPAVPAVPALPAAVPAAVPVAIPGVAQETPASPVVKVKVDQAGEKGLPFEHALIGYWGAGPFTPFEGEEGPSIADALKQGYNVICVSFGDQFTLDGDFKMDTDMCPSNRDHSNLPTNPHEHQCAPSKANVTKEAGMSIDSWRYILSFGGAAGPGPYSALTTVIPQCPHTCQHTCQHLQTVNKHHLPCAQCLKRRPRRSARSSRTRL